MGPPQWYDLATSILEECKQATLNPDIRTVVMRILDLHPVPQLPRLAEVLCTKQNGNSDEAPSLSGGMINVLLSVTLTNIFRDNVVGMLERSPQRVEVKRAVRLFRDGLEPPPVHHPLRLSACSSVADALYTHFQQSGEREDLDEAISLHRHVLELRPAGHPDQSASEQQTRKLAKNEISAVR